jgi:hypothetical protein
VKKIILNFSRNFREGRNLEKTHLQDSGPLSPRIEEEPSSPETVSSSSSSAVTLFEQPETTTTNQEEDLKCRYKMAIHL